MKKEILERAEEVIKFNESKKAHQEKMVDQKKRIVERMQEKYSNGEISYEKLFNAQKDLAVYEDFLNHTNLVLSEINYIINGE